MASWVLSSICSRKRVVRAGVVISSSILSSSRNGDPDHPAPSPLPPATRIEGVFRHLFGNGNLCLPGAARKHGRLFSGILPPPPQMPEPQPQDSASVVPNCPKCQGPMWDNREGKRNPKAPDYKCKDRECDGVIWPPRATTAGAPAGAAVASTSTKSAPQPSRPVSSASAATGPR